MFLTNKRKLFTLHFKGYRRNRRAKNNKYKIAIIPPEIILIDVAKAAPITPQPKGKIKIQSSTTLITAVTRLQNIASFGAPSRRIINKETAIQI